MATFAEFAEWNSGQLMAGVEALADVSRRLAVVRPLLDVARVTSSTWSGPASEAASARQIACLARVQALEQCCAAAIAALSTAAQDVTALNRLVAQAQVRAQAYGLGITATGAVLDAAGVSSGLGGSEVEALIAEARSRAAAIDRELARALLTVASTAPVSSTSDMSTPRTTVAVALPAPSFAHSSSPDLVALWATLTPAQHDDLVARRPDLVGPANGLPAWARDRANRILLRRAKAMLEEDADRLRPPDVTLADVLGGVGGALTVGTFGGGAGRVAYQETMGKLAAVQATERVLAHADGQTRQLLLLDVTGRSAKVAVSVGDLDRANHVAVVVDGFTTTVQRDLAGADRAAAELGDLARREAMGWGDRGEVAVVTWMGYDAPQAADTLRSTHSVVLRTSAEAAAVPLAGFLQSVQRNRHLTVVAHSYGSTVAGLAAASGGTNVDDLVVLGSPGLGVSSTAQLGMPAARVHVLESSNDPVADLGWFGPDPDHLEGVDLLTTDGANLPSGTTGRRSLGHSEYLTPGTTSQWNVAAVIGGAPVLAVRRTTVR